MTDRKNALEAHPEEYGHWDVEDIRRLLRERDALRAALAHPELGDVSQSIFALEARADRYEEALRESLDCGLCSKIVRLALEHKP
jgi:hypothetical protein